MKMPTNVKLRLQGAGLGLVAALFLLPNLPGGWGWYTAGGADKMARQRANTAVVEALAPVCASVFASQPDAAVRRAALEKADSWDRRKLVSLPGQKEMPSDVAGACVDLIRKSKPV